MPIQLRPQATVPADKTHGPDPNIYQSRGLQVTVLHPGYPGPPLSLFSLPCFDRIATGELVGQAGIDGNIVACAASIVCGNRQGQLLPTLHRSQTELEGATSTASAQAESSLLPGKYYYYPTGWKVTDDPYPITLTFEDWQFPHGEVPEAWKVFPGSEQCLSDLILSSEVRLFVIRRDRCCPITGWENVCEVAHLLPKQNENWFDLNQMGQYNRSNSTSDSTDPNNLLLLREDLHSAFDKKAFILVPKEGRQVLHFIAYMPPVTDIFHNREIGCVQVSMEMAYARLAWSLFPLIGTGNIVKSNSGIFVTIFDSTLNQYVTRKMAKDVMAMRLQGNTAPRKRKMLGANLNQISEALKETLDSVAHRLEVLLPSGIEAHYSNGAIGLSVEEAGELENEETPESGRSAEEAGEQEDKAIAEIPGSSL